MRKRIPKWLRYMVGAVAIIAAMAVGPSPLAYSAELNELSDQFRSFDYETATDFSAIESVVQNEIRSRIQEQLSTEVRTFMNDFRQSWVAENGPVATVGVNPDSILLNPEYREALSTALQEKMRGDFTTSLEGYLRDRLLEGAGDAAGQVESMISQITSEAIGQVGGLVDQAINSATNMLNVSLGPMDAADFLTSELSRDLSRTAGESASEGLKQFMDGSMREAFNIATGTDVAEFLENKLQTAANEIDNIRNTYGINNINDIKSQIQSVLDASGLTNQYGLNAADYLFGATGLDSLSNTMNSIGVDLPSIEVPAGAYGAIQIAAAAQHYIRAIKVFGIDFEEIRKGNNCIKTAQWALSDKDRAFTIVGNRLGPSNVLSSFGMDFANSELLGELNSILERMENLNVLDNALAQAGINDVLEDLGDIKEQLDAYIAQMRQGVDAATGAVTDAVGEAVENAVAQVTEPIEDAMAGAQEAVQGAADQANQAITNVEDQMLATMEAPMSDVWSVLDPVVLYRGEFKVEMTDFKMKSRGVPFEFKRIYRSGWSRDSIMGYNWTHNYDQRLIVDRGPAGVIRFSDETGQVYAFKLQPDGTYKSPYQLFVKLERTDEGYVITYGDGMTKHFDGGGFLKRIEDRHGNAMEFRYNTLGSKRVLRTITDTEGREYTFTYDNGRVSTLTGPFGRMVSYEYSSLGDLISVKSPATIRYPDGRITRYSYSGGYTQPALNHNLTMVMDPKGQVYLENTYGTEDIEFDRVIKQRFGEEDAPEMTVSYEKVTDESTTNEMNAVASRTKVIDRMGVEHVYEHNKYGLRITGEGYRYYYNANGQVVEKVSPGGRVTSYAYDSGNADRTKQGNMLEKKTHGVDGTEEHLEYGYGPFNQVAGFIRHGVKAPGREVTFEFDEKGDRVSQTAGGEKTEYRYNDYGQLIREESFGIVKEYTYDGARVVEVREHASPDERRVRVTYNKYGYIDTVTDALGNVTQYWTDALGRIVKKRDAAGVISNYAHDENDNLISLNIENRGGKNREGIGYMLRQEFKYDVYDNLVSKRMTVDKNSWAEERYIYDNAERVTEVIQPDGVKKGYRYNDKGWVVAELINGEEVVTRKYNADGEIVAETDALGNTRTWKRDGLGRVIEYVDGTGTKLTVGYNDFGEIRKYSVGNESILMSKHFVYNELGRLIKEGLYDTANEKWLTKERTYEKGRLAQITDPDGLISKYAYDGFGRLAEIEDGSGNRIEMSYNLRNDLIERSVNKGKHSIVERFTYDELGRKTKAANARRVTDQWAYDSVGNVISHKDALGSETLYEYDGLGRVLKEQRGERVRSWSWTKRGLLSAFIDGDNQKTEYAYDDAARMSEKKDPDGVKTTYNYDVLGRLIEKQVGKSEYAFTYDANGKLIQRISGGYEQRFVYDGLGRMVASFDSNNPENVADNVAVSLEYNSLNQLMKECVNGRDVLYSYDRRGNVKRMLYPSGMVVKKEFDQAGLISKINMGGDAIAEYEYALLGWKSAEQLGNGTTKSYHYDDLMQLTRESVHGQREKMRKVTLYDYQYSYDPLGRVVMAEDLREKKWTGYGYDPLDRLSQVAVVGVNPGKRGDLFANIWRMSKHRNEYTMTLEGDWLTRAVKQRQETIAVGGGHRYEKMDGQKLAYDERGNLSGDGKNEYMYDPWNRIVGAKTAAGEVIAYAYDANNRRVQKWVGNTMMTYTYDHWKVIEDYEGGKVTQQYVHGQRMDDAVALVKDGERYYYVQDRLGSVVALTDKEGKVKERYEYDEYGRVTVLDGEGKKVEKSQVGNAIAYTGQRYDEETGLYYYKNRYYSAKLGRFMSKDPLGMIDGPNLYAYVLNDPINYIDPTGTTILPWSDPNVLEDDVVIDDPLADIFDIKPGSPEMDDVVIQENDAMNPGQSAKDCPVEEGHIVFAGVGASAFWGELFPPNMNTSGNSPRGFGKEAYFGIAYNTLTGEHKYFRAVGVADSNDIVSGINFGPGITAGMIRGDFKDFFGRSTEYTGSVVIGIGEIHDQIGNRGYFINLGPGVSYSVTGLDVFTEEIKGK